MSSRHLSCSDSAVGFMPASVSPLVCRDEAGTVGHEASPYPHPLTATFLLSKLPLGKGIPQKLKRCFGNWVFVCLFDLILFRFSLGEGGARAILSNRGQQDFIRHGAEV